MRLLLLVEGFDVLVQVVQLEHRQKKTNYYHQYVFKIVYHESRQKLSHLNPIYYIVTMEQKLPGHKWSLSYVANSELV